MKTGTHTNECWANPLYCICSDVARRLTPADVDHAKDTIITPLRAKEEEWRRLYERAEASIQYGYMPEAAQLRSQLSARDAEVRALREAVQTAYGYLWCVNSKLGTPHHYSAERAAYEARKALRDLLTNEQRGAGINAAMAIVRKGDES